MKGKDVTGNVRLTCAVGAIALFSAVYSYGQAVNATLLGTVRDSTGGVLPNAKVTITETGTGVSRSNQTNESGNYTFPDLAPGRYAVSFEAPGFKKETRQGVVVEINTSVRIDGELQPGNVSESIEVTAAPPVLQTDRADTGRKIDTVVAVNLPLGTNRNFQNLLNLVPGTTRASFQHSQFFNATSSLQTEVNGQMRMGNNFQIEGIDDNERTGLLQVYIPPVEAIQTVDVSTSNFEAELGRASGAVTNVQLKAGTNSFHGAAYEFLRNNDLNARSFFVPSNGHLAYNYVGGNIGGPVLRNKIFFFADYLKVLDHEANTNNETIPSMDFRAGDLSAAPTTIYNPFTGDSEGTGRTPFPDNRIPLSMINPVSAKILGLVPGPNRPFDPTKPNNNYFALLPFTKDTDSLDVKIDDNITDKDRLSGRFSFQRPLINQAPIFGLAGGPAQGAFEGTGIQRTYSAGLNYDRIFSNTLIAEFRVGAAHYHNEALNADYGSTASTAIGIPGVNVSQFTSGLAGVTINGGFSNPMVGYSPSLPWIRAEANIDVVNTWTKILGNHTFKFGIDLRRLRDDLLQEQTFSPRGAFTFSEAQTSIPGAKTGFGNDFASFLLDQPSKVGRDLNIYFPAYRAWQFFSFAQDKWQVSPKLTLDLGLRWEFYPPATPQFAGGFSNYDPTNNTLVVAGVGGNPSNLGMITRYKYFAPRFGAAYRLTDSTVLRAGFGISYTPFPDNTYAYNFPVKQNNSFQPAGSGYGPALLGNGQPATFQAGFPPPTPATIPTNCSG
ncbi:MAG: TonB-dependent receptor domain-containing protein, partial [Bryobacteraceae bacterium]